MSNDSKLKKLRLEAKVSQARLAGLAELDRGTISAAERGKPIQELTLSKLTDALSKLLGREIVDSDVI